MLILKRRYEFWFCLLALHKLGAVAIPATHLLTAKDIVYRNNAADIKMIVARRRRRGPGPASTRPQADSPDARAQGRSSAAQRAGLVRLRRRDRRRPRPISPGPTGAAATSNDDMLLLYFTSGTTGMPKMVRHDFTYPLGHILTAKYWQNVQDDGLHLTVADTGWAKAAWGKIYGQWICRQRRLRLRLRQVRAQGAAAGDCRTHGVTTFCAPPTIYRFLIKEDLAQYDLSSLKYCVVAGEPLNPEVYNQFLQDDRASSSWKATARRR